MTDYQKAYLILFNAITDALERLAEGQTETARDLLAAAQQRTEEVFMDSGES